MGSFRTLTAADVEEILQAFGAPGYLAHRPIQVGTINTNLHIETEGGPRFLRINEGKSAEDVAREAAIVSHAAAHGVPTPAPVVARDGRPYAVWSGAVVSLFPWLPGRTLTRAQVLPAHAREVGAALARLHLGSDGFTDRRAGRYEPDEIDRRLSLLASPWVAASHPELDEAVAILTPELAALHAERVAEVPLGIVHGDLFIDNVLYREESDEAFEAAPDPTSTSASGQLVALLDFEQAAWGRFVYDLAVTLLAFAFGREDFRPEIVRALLDGYSTVRSPTAAERAAFGAELRFASCRFAVTRITDVHLKRGAGAPPGKDFERYLSRLDRVRHHLAAGAGLLDL
jgi:homoserine kinase type II